MKTKVILVAFFVFFSCKEDDPIPEDFDRDGISVMNLVMCLLTSR